MGSSGVTRASILPPAASRKGSCATTTPKTTSDTQDERNRNVTFLKRKAGLMKKAYELSVLCGVSVNILIFGANGKPYEFSSGDFDTEVDRYNDYEGTIERRRGAEFEAMALAGEDSEDDEKPGNKPSKSLKGKESFKARRGEMNGNGKRRREREDSFVGGIFEDERTPPPPRPESPVCTRVELC